MTHAMVSSDCRKSLEGPIRREASSRPYVSTALMTIGMMEGSRHKNRRSSESPCPESQGRDEGSLP